MAGCKEADDRTDVVLRPLREYSAQIKLQLVRATGPRVSQILLRLQFRVQLEILILNWPGMHYLALADTFLKLKTLHWHF